MLSARPPVPPPPVADSTLKERTSLTLFPLLSLALISIPYVPREVPSDKVELNL